MSEICEKGSCSISPSRVVKTVARQRWKILANVIKKNKAELENISVRRFSSYGLIQTSPLPKPPDHPADEGAAWYQYTCPGFPEFKSEIRHLEDAVAVKNLMGFNNTGNVCVWPAEEILTYYCLKHPELFRDKIVCELGGGMTCLAGVAVAQCTAAKEILLTDGNENSVQNVEETVLRNSSKFGATKVSTRLLVWDKMAKLGDLEEAFDIIICADCLFMDQYREDLLWTLHKLLKPGGEVINFAPVRGKTFSIFENLISESAKFQFSKEEKYDDTVWNLHTELKEKGKSSYDENIHYPLLLQMKKTSSS